MQIAPELSVAEGARGQLFVCAKSLGFAPPRLMDEIVTGEAPVFLSVTLCAALGGPSFCVGKVRLAGVSDTLAVAPVPLSAIVCCGGLALSEIKTLAVREPAAVGWNVTEIVQLAPAANVADASGHVVVSAKSLAFGPVIPMLAMDSAALPVFLSSTGGWLVEPPTLTLPKLSVVLAKPTAGIAAVASVPDSAIAAVPDD